MKNLIVVIFILCSFIISSQSIEAKDYSKMSLEKLEKEANKGNANIQAYLGHLYYSGETNRNIPQDYIAAAYWFRKATAQGNGKAMFYLGQMHYYGKGLVQDFDEAIKLYERCDIINDKYYMETGFAKLILAECYLKGLHGKYRNLNKALELAKSVELAYIDLSGKSYELDGKQYKMLGDIYLALGNERFSADDYKKSYDSYVEAADDFQRWSVMRFRERTASTNRYCDEFYESHLLAGNAMVLYNITTDSNDYNKVVYHWDLAGSFGNAQAQYNLGYQIYLNGCGNIPKDMAKAKKWLTKAANQGHQDAINALKNIR